MTKLALMPVLLIIACLFAGTYGALHDQISYTVSPEYFTQFKFEQFRLYNVPGRLGAAIVGWLATWWMGLGIGIILIPMGLVLRGTRHYYWSMIRVFGIVTVTTLLVGLGGLAIASLTIDPATVGEVTQYGNNIVDDVAFMRVGTMHNFSYLGGFFGLIAGSVAIFWQRRHDRKKSVRNNKTATFKKR